MKNLLERLTWVIMKNQGADAGMLAEVIVREIQSTHAIIDPEDVTEAMLDACFNALPQHYDPPDPKRRPWHGYKARLRYTAMVKAAKKVC